MKQSLKTASPKASQPGIDPAADAEPKVVSANNPGDRIGNLKSVGGSSSDSFNRKIANQATQVLCVKNSSPEQRDKQLSATIGAMIGVAPKDELEGMIAGQLIASHNAAMECYRRAMIGEQSVEGRRENLTQANKCSRTHAALLEALNRHRGKGQQKVVVEHVNVHAGGQAVVGNVSTPALGGWACEKSREQPHAKQIEHAPGVEMPGTIEEEWPTVPVASSTRV
jgi:hypothetical protein